MRFYWYEQKDSKTIAKGYQKNSKRNLHQRKIFISTKSAIKPPINEKYNLTYSFSEQNEQTTFNY
jgi:hypothetical protein